MCNFDTQLSVGAVVGKGNFVDEKQVEKIIQIQN